MHDCARAKGGWGMLRKTLCALALTIFVSGEAAAQQNAPNGMPPALAAFVKKPGLWRITTLEQQSATKPLPQGFLAKLPPDLRKMIETMHGHFAIIDDAAAFLASRGYRAEPFPPGVWATMCLANAQTNAPSKEPDLSASCVVTRHHEDDTYYSSEGVCRGSGYLVRGTRIIQKTSGNSYTTQVRFDVRQGDTDLLSMGSKMEAQWASADCGDCKGKLVCQSFDEMRRIIHAARSKASPPAHPN